jgi:hypothetical protein
MRSGRPGLFPGKAPTPCSSHLITHLLVTFASDSDCCLSVTRDMQERGQAGSERRLRSPLFKTKIGNDTTSPADARQTDGQFAHAEIKKSKRTASSLCRGCRPSVRPLVQSERGYMLNLMRLINLANSSGSLSPEPSAFSSATVSLIANTHKAGRRFYHLPATSFQGIPRRQDQASVKFRLPAA